jgi:hypothetical protein
MVRKPNKTRLRVKTLMGMLEHEELTWTQVKEARRLLDRIIDEKYTPEETQLAKIERKRAEFRNTDEETVDIYTQFGVPVRSENIPPESPAGY